MSDSFNFEIKIIANVLIMDVLALITFQKMDGSWNHIISKKRTWTWALTISTFIVKVFSI